MEKKLWFVFCKSDILLRKTSEGGYEIPYSEQPPTELKPWTTVHNITPMGNIQVQAYRIEAPVRMMPTMKCADSVLPTARYRMSIT